MKTIYALSQSIPQYAVSGLDTPDAAPAHLTPRQLDVLALLCEGLPNKLICRQLNISAATVKVHIGCILRALNVHSRLQAVIAAQRLGLAGEPAMQALRRPNPAVPSGPPAILEIGLDDVAARLLRTVSDTALVVAA